MIIMFQIKSTVLGIFFVAKNVPYTLLFALFVYIEFIYAVTDLANDYLTISLNHILCSIPISCLNQYYAIN